MTVLSRELVEGEEMPPNERVSECTGSSPLFSRALGDREDKSVENADLT